MVASVENSLSTTALTMENQKKEWKFECVNMTNSLQRSHLKLHVDTKYTKGYTTSHRERAQDVLALKKNEWIDI